MAMILEAQLPLPRSATSEELVSMGMQERVHPQGDRGVSPAEDEEILLCF
jgi:hypothetical protein